MKHTGFKVIVIVFLVLMLAIQGAGLYIRYREWESIVAQQDLASQQLTATQQLQQLASQQLQTAGQQLQVTQQQVQLAQEEKQDRQTAATKAAGLSKIVGDFNKGTDELITGLLDYYKADAYGAGVDRIAEQQLAAAEYTLRALQLVMEQNQLLLQVLAGK